MAQIDTVGEALRALRRRAGLIVLLIVLGVAGSFSYAYTRDRIYEAVASVQIETPQIALGGDGGMGRGEASIDYRISLIEQRLKARDTLEQVIADLRLFTDLTELSAAERVVLLRQSVTITRIIDQSMGWRPDQQSTGLLITVRMDDGETAAAVANAFLDLILSAGRARATDRAESTLTFFVAEEARVSARIAQVEADTATLKSTNVGALPENAAARSEQLQLLQEAQLLLEQQRITFEQERERLRFDEAARQETIFREQAALVAARISDLRRLEDAAPEVERQLNLLERERARLQEEFTVITARRAQAAMTQELETREQAERFEVLERATTPEYPVSTSRRKLLLLGVVVSLVGAIGAALGLEWISPRLRTSAQVERALGLRPVVVIPDLRVPRGRRLT
ncbi:MAG: Wzz/FepE/Etk N-terminal domain-containing protein [Paracoccaceae bacterium]|nr:Wzz/FepE/Etk N-terminal domain-containing protein [Paracoccaceae bacterium]